MSLKLKMHLKVTKNPALDVGFIPRRNLTLLKSCSRISQEAKMDLEMA